MNGCIVCYEGKYFVAWTSRGGGLAQLGEYLSKLPWLYLSANLSFFQLVLGIIENVTKCVVIMGTTFCFTDCS